MARAATHRRLRAALDREDSTRPRRGLCCALSGLAAGKKPACLGCNPPPLRNARRRHGPCGHAPAARAALDREDSTRPRRGLCCALSRLAAGKKPACLGCNPPLLRNARRRHGPCGHTPAQSRRRLSHRTQMFPVAQARQRPDNCPGAFSARPAKRGRRRCAQVFLQESLSWK